jgi:hypothetical protein
MVLLPAASICFWISRARSGGAQPSRLAKCARIGAVTRV